MRAIKLELGGKERGLRFDLNALAEIGDRLSIKIRLDHLKEDLLGVPLPLSALRVVLWAGLIHEDPELKPEEVGAWVDTENVGVVLAAFFSLFGARLPVKDREQVAEKLGIQVGQEAEEEVAVGAV